MAMKKLENGTPPSAFKDINVEKEKCVTRKKALQKHLHLGKDRYCIIVSVY